MKITLEHVHTVFWIIVTLILLALAFSWVPTTDLVPGDQSQYYIQP